MPGERAVRTVLTWAHRGSWTPSLLPPRYTPTQQLLSVLPLSGPSAITPPLSLICLFSFLSRLHDPFLPLSVPFLLPVSFFPSVAPHWLLHLSSFCADFNRHTNFLDQLFRLPFCTSSIWRPSSFITCFFFFFYDHKLVITRSLIPVLLRPLLMLHHLLFHFFFSNLLYYPFHLLISLVLLSPLSISHFAISQQVFNSPYMYSIGQVQQNYKELPKTVTQQVNFYTGY